MIIDGTVYVPVESEDGLADWLPLFDAEEVCPDARHNLRR